jgi:hypothetical protein
LHKALLAGWLVTKGGFGREYDLNHYLSGGGEGKTQSLKQMFVLLAKQTPVDGEAEVEQVSDSIAPDARFDELFFLRCMKFCSQNGVRQRMALVADPNLIIAFQVIIKGRPRF